MAHEIKLSDLFIQKTFDNQSENMDVVHGVNDYEHVDINMGSIVDILIENVGRYCDRHRNDFLITWESVQAAIANPTQGDTYIAFGIRRMGVDSNIFLYDRVKNHKNQPGWAENFYRKIFILRINRSLESGTNGQNYDDVMVITVTLKDVTYDIRTEDLRYIETNTSTHNSDIEFGTITAMKATVSDTDPNYERLQTAYKAYENNQPFTPDTSEAREYMRYYMNIHEITPRIHSADSLAGKLSDRRKNENDWRNTSEDDWTKYCDTQIGLVAAILAIRTKEC